MISQQILRCWLFAPYRPSLTAAGALRDCRASCVVARWHGICNWTEGFVFVGFEIETALLQFATMYQHHILLQIHWVLAPAGTPFPSPSEVYYEDLSCNMTIVAFNSIGDSLCPGVRHAVSTCHKTHVTIRMYTRGNVLTALSIATQCGFIPLEMSYSPFSRTLNPQEGLEVIPY